MKPVDEMGLQTGMCLHVQTCVQTAGESAACVPVHTARAKRDMVLLLLLKEA